MGRGVNREAAASVLTTRIAKLEVKGCWRHAVYLRYGLNLKPQH
jgi:hypothetical protein